MRNLGLIVALCLAAVLPTNSLALGLGEIEVKSFLNQPLNAEIEVISARPGEIDDLLVSLASREAFSRAGLSRPRHLSDLRFQVRKSEDGEQAVIIVTTKDAVKEPFLNFLIEADWSKGRVLREFTVLLDPPFFANQPPPVEPVAIQPVAPSDEAPSVSQIAEQAGVVPTQPAPIAAEPAPTITEPIALSESTPAPPPPPEPISQPSFTAPTQDIIRDDVLVVRGNTLWSIASRFKAPDQTMSQVMLAFQRANPNAFNNNNINNLKTGAVLRVPDASEIKSLGQREAYAEVLVQNGLWEEYVARVTGRSPTVAVDSDAGAGVGDTAGEPDAGGELSLLVPGDGTSDRAGTGDPGEIDELRTKLALAEEELDAARIENVELESRIAELQARLSKLEELQKMIEIEDDSLAQLQADQAQTEVPLPLPVDQIPDGESEESVADEAALAETSETTIDEQLQSEEEALLEELLAEEAAAQAEESAVAAGTDIPDGESEETVSNQPDDAAADEAPIDGEMIAEAGQSDLIPPPAPVIVTQPVSREPSIFDGILPPDIIDMIPSMPDLGGIGGIGGGFGSMFADPIILAALGGVVVLLLVLLLIKRRRAGADEESGIMVSDDGVVALVDEDDEELTPVHLVEGATPEETDIKVPTEADLEPLTETEDFVDDMAKTAVISAVELPDAEAPAPAAAEGEGEQDDVLNEVDVYLAYGLYDNAEELLNSSIAENPQRADYRSKLLDTYFATKNADAFVKEAENLKSMGDAGAHYWDRVQVMGYELAPDNPLFSDAKDSGLSAADLEIAKPQEADFDLGAADEDETNFSTTDFQLGEEDTDGDFNDTANLGEAGQISATQQIDQLPDLPQLDDDEDTNIRAEEEVDTGLDLPDEIGEELEFSMGDSAAADAGAPETDLSLPEDLEIDDEITATGDEIADSEDDTGVLDLDATEEFAFDAEIDAMIDDDAVDFAEPEEEPAKTEIITPNFEDTDFVAGLGEPEADEDASEIDLGMDDTMAALAGSDDTGEINLDTGELTLDIGGADEDDEDISIIDFGGDDFVEPTDIVESVDDDSMGFDIDMDDDEEVKTGTFAPGDFEEPTAATPSIADIDDIGDLMLPDDVDEVSTKLDLARAFIDMGDTEGARGSLEEVISEGNEEQKAEAKTLLEQI